MLKLHFAPNSRAGRIVWLLEELELPYDINKMAFSQEDLKSDEHRARHPLGRVPVLEDGDIQIYESGAIVEYVLERHKNGGLKPSVDSDLYPQYLQWFHYCEGMVMPPVNTIVVQTVLLPPDRRDEKVLGQAQRLLSKALEPVNQSLEGKDYSTIYEKLFQSLNEQLVETLLTDERHENGLTPGYTFGYVNETLTTDSLKYYNPDGVTPYNLDEEEKTLGKFGSERILALDPGLYGGRYSNPPYFIEPRRFTGWLEIATKAFDSPSGCDPKTPPLISFHDIKKRTKDLSQSLKNDPRLSQNPECIKDTPFKALLDKKTQAHMDGIVRTTIRSYVAEYFMKGYGLFSNVEMNSENFDQSMFMYLVSKMKKEMHDLGLISFNRRITIKREKYWYTFLEQCVEAYQRMIDVDGLQPPDEIMEALNEIQKGIDANEPVDSDSNRRMRKNFKESGEILLPPKDYDPLEVVRQGPVSLGLQGIAFMLTKDPEEKADFFNGGSFDDVTSTNIRWSSIKKVKFFQKQYFIALYEKQATLIMSELIKDEYNRLMDIVVDGLSDKPYHTNISKSIFSILPGSTSRVGTSPFYVEKQTTTTPSAGSIPEVVASNAAPPVAPTDKPQFIVESYARLIDREDPNLPTIIKNRAQKYIGAISLSSLSEFVSQNLDALEENHLSDFFGNLAFTYKGSFKELMSKGFADDYWIKRIIVM